jgi:hypothetical protein
MIYILLFPVAVELLPGLIGRCGNGRSTFRPLHDIDLKMRTSHYSSPLFLEIKKTACTLQTVLHNNGISCVTFYLKQSLRIPEGKHIKGSWRRQRRGR